jgi:tetratricopeptide (TPR) repeat protein
MFRVVMETTLLHSNIVAKGRKSRAVRGRHAPELYVRVTRPILTVSAETCGHGRDAGVESIVARSFYVVIVALLVACTGADAFAQETARITVEQRSIKTYPFSGPNRLPILGSDPRLYPYHRFEGYAHEAQERDWTVVHLENEWIELWVLPEVGGKVWGARVKATGHEFIYRNEVLKFRNIALRGPWTSGGIEFNFGVIGHTPSTATPVDWDTRENGDGSVSVFVGAMDLPSRTRWRVEVRLPADRAYFETRALWHNPTTVEQPYYNWMTAAAFARDDLVMSIPGNAYLEHPGGERAWPIDASGHRLPVYAENRFGENKSFHVVGELNDFFGGYYRDDRYGFGHWARHEEMPGQKLWLWALSRQGGIWEDLLTDTDGQYVEFQAGRLLVQYSPTGAVNPISQAGFEAGATDRWTETWFPVEGLGGLTDASRDGAMAVERMGDDLALRIHAFGALTDTLRVLVDGRQVLSEAIRFDVLTPVERALRIAADARVQVELKGLALAWDSAPGARALVRPWTTGDDAVPSIPETDRLVEEAAELVQGRYLERARVVYALVLDEEPWNRDALLGMAELEYRRGRFEDGLALVDRALRLDTYDAEANFVAGNLHSALGHELDARDAYGWSARSMTYRAVAYTRLAEIALASGASDEAERYAGLAQDYDRHAPAPRHILAILARIRGDATESARILGEAEAADPLDHVVAAERYLDGPRDSAGGASLRARFRGEYPEQEVLELGLDYVRRGRVADALAVLGAVPEVARHPMARAWRAFLTADPAPLAGGSDPAFVFPYRAESIRALRYAVERDAHWSWAYLLALNLWARDRSDEAGTILHGLGDVPDFAPFYVARAAVASVVGPSSPLYRSDRESDLRRAIALDPSDRALRVPLLRYLQEEGRWEDALTASSEAMIRFPVDADLALLHVASLVETMRWQPALEILDRVRVLPSENSAVAHTLFAQAHTMAGIEALEQDDAKAAIGRFETAMTWPEHLGQGRPYEPEERLPRYLLGVALRRDGQEERARAALERVVETTPPDVFAGGAIVRLDLLGAAALADLGRSGELQRFGDGPEGALARVASAVRSAAESGADVRTALTQELQWATAEVAGVDGRLLWRGLALRE